MSPAGPVRVCVVGCGGVSGSHLAAYQGHRLAALVSCVDVRQPVAERAAQHYGAARWETDWEAAMERDDVDLVDVCLPHDLHAPVAIAAARAGKHVFVEKPIANTLDEADAMIAAARAAGVRLMVDQTKRFEPRHRRIKELVEAGVIGAPLLAKSAYPQDITYAWEHMDPGRKRTYWKHDGVIGGIGIHTLDLLQWFVGPVTDVRGTVATLALPHVIEVEDTAALRLQHRTATGDTASSVFHATNGHVENAPVTVEIVTEHARLRLDTDLTVTHDDGRVETFHPATAASGERAYWGASHGLLIDDFYRHVRVGKHFWIDAPAALETLRVIQAAYDQTPGLGR